MNQKRVKNTHIWGKKMLGIKDGEEEDAEEDEN
jgi:hypothetical protein